MKKNYLQPRMVEYDLCTSSSLLGLSGNFKEGQTGHVGVSDDELEGDVWTKSDVWGDVWE